MATMKLWPPFSFLERRSVDNPTDEEFAVLTGAVAGTTSLGVALTVPAVQAAIRVISEAAACLDIAVVEIAGDGTETPVRGHPVAQLLADQPNDWQSTYDLIRDLVATALTHDRGGIAWVNRIGSEVREVIRYEPAHTFVDFSTDGRQEPTFKVNNRPVPASDVIHLRSPFGRAPLSLAADAIGVAKVMEGHAKRLFENGAKPSGVLKSPKPIGDDAAKKIAAAFKKAFVGAENAGKVPVLWDGMEFVPITLTSVDAQFLELRKEQVIEIARAFRVPPSMLFELDRATWSNSEQMGREFLTYCLEPWLKALEGAMRRALFTADERRRFAIRFDRDDLTRADLTARATAINSLVASRVLNPNEGRNWLGLAPYAGGNVFANPNTGSNQPGAAAPQPPKEASLGPQ
ncbi:Phage portal protein [uncultured Pleomorphomonas sp.]|uniref:Phage portal protein n=2 Tax=uncultured Pleomorphomonas sp. TaxID=442121 RepID=A0A212KXL8_9HYPH|nr:Phage portal protein [uncultured Pleomorphomonas sp.]SCM75116.1 Phage portal protein [uncultured Pleomorphomonas sp.]